MKNLAIFMALAFTASTALGQTPVPDPYKNMQWHRKQTQNFEIVAIDAAHAQQLSVYVENLKTWIYKRWGLNNVPFDKPCMIICVPSQAIFSEFFRKDSIEPHIANSKNFDGADRSVYGIWIAADTSGRWLTASLPEKIGRVCMMNYESTYRIGLGLWLQVGSATLNNDVGVIRSVLSRASSTTLSAEQLFAETQASYDAKTPEQKMEFRRCSTALCLLLRKEFGEQRFHSFLSQTAAQGSPAIQVYGFTSLSQLNASYIAYVNNLSYDLQQGVTPNSYLTWFFAN